MKEITRKRLMIFSGRSYPELGQEIAGHLGLSLGDVELKTFSNGELYVRFQESVRGIDAFVVQTSAPPINRNIMEMLLMIDALKRASAKRISAVIPYYGYSRQDKKTVAREPISAKLMADLLTAAGADRILTLDLHAGQIQGFFDGPVDHLTAVPQLASHISRNYFDDLVIVSPDAGRVKTAKKYSDYLSVPMAIMHKRRPDHNVAEVMHVIGEVEGKKAILVDDMIDTAGTLASSAAALHERGRGGDLRLRHPRHLLRPGPGENRRLPHQGDHRHQHPAHPRGEPEFQGQGDLHRLHHRQLHRQRLQGRVGERAVRRRQPAVKRATFHQ